MAWGDHEVPWAGGRLVCQEPPPLEEGADLGTNPPEGNPAGEPGETEHRTLMGLLWWS